MMALLPVALAGTVYAQSQQSPQKEEIVLTTYYPVPYGDYRKMRLWPTELTSNETCDNNSEGTMYYNKETGQAMICKKVSFDTYEWKPIGGSGVPIGTIVAWHKSMSGTPVLPEGWVECNGQTIDDPASPYNGQAVPNLNSAVQDGSINSGMFLRGGPTSGIMQEDATAANNLRYLDTYHRNYCGWMNGSDCQETYYRQYTKTAAIESQDPETRPANMSAVWIIRIK